MEASGLRVGVGEDDANDNGAIDGDELLRIRIAGLSTAELQAPTDYAGIYGMWDVDLGGRYFGDGVPDEPWDFGTATQYPALSVDLSGDNRQTWQEFGYQFRAALPLAGDDGGRSGPGCPELDAADRESVEASHPASPTPSTATTEMVSRHLRMR